MIEIRALTCLLLFERSKVTLSVTVGLSIEFLALWQKSCWFTFKSVMMQWRFAISSFGKTL